MEGDDARRSLLFQRRETSEISTVSLTVRAELLLQNLRPESSRRFLAKKVLAATVSSEALTAAYCQ